MKLEAWTAASLIVLTGCATTMGGSESRQIQQHGRHLYPAAQIRTLRIENVVGAIAVTASTAPNATIDYTKYSGSQDAMNNTQVVFERTGDQLHAYTNYIKHGWFGSSGAGVDYIVAVPPGTAVHLENVSGPITLKNLTADADISEVSGDVLATLGRLGGTRSVRVNTVSGKTTLQIARNSDVTIDIKNVHGTIQTFLPYTADKGFIGQTLRSHAGSGSASIDVNSVSGNVSVVPQ